jgi:hypothetical protein
MKQSETNNPRYATTTKSTTQTLSHLIAFGEVFSNEDFVCVC